MRLRAALDALSHGSITAPGRLGARSYIVALAATLAATALTAAIDPWIGETQLVVYFAVVAVAGWYGGLVPGLLTAGLSSVLGAWLFLEPERSLAIKSDALLSTVAFLVVAFVISSLSEQSHRAARRAALAEQRMAFLSDASAVRVSSLDYATTLTHITRLAVPTIADWCTVNLSQPDGQIARLASAHRDPAAAEALRLIQERYPIDLAGDHPLAVAIRTGEARLYGAVSPDFSRNLSQDAEHQSLSVRLGTSSAIVAPLVARGRTFGAIAFALATPGRHYTLADQEMAVLLARRAALAIDNARLLRDAQASETHYRTLFEGSEDAVVVIDADGRYIDVNPATEALVGYSRDELMALRAGDLLEERDEWRAQALPRFLAEGSWRGETELRRKDGSVVPVEARMMQVELPSGSVSVATWRDISERRALEQLQHEFIVMVTHDLKTPLTSIRGLAQLMQRRGHFDAAMLETIVSQSDHLGRLINDLLDVARLEAGRLELQRAPVDLGALARATAAEAQATTRLHAIRADLPVAAVTGSWDAGRLRQVILNLLANAVRYTPAGGEILVRVEDGAHEARVSVIDRGIGIPPEALPRLFSRFTRVDPSQAAGEGLGLGFYICRSLVESHGGRIWVESSPGAGSTFSFTLPRGVPE